MSRHQMYAPHPHHGMVDDLPEPELLDGAPSDDDLRDYVERREPRLWEEKTR